MLIVQQQLRSLRGSGSCSLLPGLEKALQLTDVDTLLVVLGSRYYNLRLRILITAVSIILYMYIGFYKYDNYFETGPMKGDILWGDT